MLSVFIFVRSVIYFNSEDEDDETEESLDSSSSISTDLESDDSDVVDMKRRRSSRYENLPLRRSARNRRSRIGDEGNITHHSSSLAKYLNYYFPFLCLAIHVYSNWLCFTDLQIVKMRNESTRNKRTRRRKSEDTAQVRRKRKVRTVMEVSKRRRKCKFCVFFSTFSVKKKEILIAY